MKKVMLFLFLILTLVSIPVTVFFLGSQQEIRKKAAPATTLSLNPSTVNVRASDSFTVNVQIDTKTNQVVLADVRLQFDATKLEAESITNGPLFTKIYTSGVVGAGSASISVGVERETEPVVGSGIVAVVRFKALAKTDTPIQITFSDQTYVGGLNESPANVLSAKNIASVTITESIENQQALAQTNTVSSPTPSLTPSPTTGAVVSSPTGQLSSPTPTIGVTLTPTSTASPSAVTITMASDQTILSEKPTFTGTAPIGSTVTIVIQSDPITDTVIADAEGKWTYTTTVALASGTHTIVASAQNPQTGSVDTAEASFTVGTKATDITQNAMPTSGSIHTTILFSGIATVLIGIGLFIFIF